MPHTSEVYEPGVDWKARIGTALSAVAVLFLLFDSTGKLLKVATPSVREAVLSLAWSRWNQTPALI